MYAFIAPITILSLFIYLCAGLSFIPPKLYDSKLFDLEATVLIVLKECLSHNWCSSVS